MHVNCGAYVKPGVSAQLLSTVQIETNIYVMQRAHEEIGHTYGTPSKIRLFSELLKDRRVKLAGHILRSRNSDPLRSVSYERNSAVNYNVGKRRVGVPRQQWLLYTSR